jgi:hypothetical protein
MVEAHHRISALNILIPAYLPSLNLFPIKPLRNSSRPLRYLVTASSRFASSAQSLENFCP